MTQIDGEHLYLKADKGTFSEAKDTCANDYMVLAPVTTYEEYDRLMRADVIGEQTGIEANPKNASTGNAAFQL